MGRDEAGDEEGFRQFETFLREYSRRDVLRAMGATGAYLAFAAGGLEFLEACANAGQNPNAQSSVAPRRGGHVVESTASDIATTNPVLVSDVPSQQIQQLIYDSLYTSDEKGNLYPVLAAGLPKVSSDNLTYTISISEKAKWTDGKDVTADDVKFTYDLMFDPKYKAVNSPRRGDLEQFVASVTAKDAKTVVFTLKSVFAPFALNHLGYGILPQHVWGGLAPAEINTTPMNANPKVTNGIFNFVSWQKDQQVTLARNDKYYRDPAYLDTYVMKVVSGGSTAILNQMKTGEIDIAGQNGFIDASQFDAAKSVDSIRVLEVPRLSFDFYMYNLDPAKTKLFQQREVRQALFYALDRQAIVDAIYFKHATVANTTMPPLSWAYNKDNKPVYTYDKAKAEALLDAAGWKKGPDGVRTNGTDKLKFELITNAGNKVREHLITNMAQQWKDIGVDCTARFVDFNKVLVPSITNTRDFQTLMVGFKWDVDPDQSAVWHSRNTRKGGFNGMSYRNPELDKVLDDAVGTLDQKKRRELYFKMQQILAEDVPAPILDFPTLLLAANKRVQGFTPGAFTGIRVYYNKIFVTDGK